MYRNTSRCTGRQAQLSWRCTIVHTGRQGGEQYRKAGRNANKEKDEQTDRQVVVHVGRTEVLSRQGQAADLQTSKQRYGQTVGRQMDTTEIKTVLIFPL
jgi:hypothetical protein